MPALRKDYVSTLAGFKRFLSWSDSADLRHLRANYEKTHRSHIFCVWSHGCLWGSTSTDIWRTENREVCAESCIMMTTFHQASVSSSHRIAETTAERMSTCIYQEVGPYPCQQSLKYVNVLMLFHWVTTIWGSLDWWHLKMDSNYVQFVPFHPGSFESVIEQYLHILRGTVDCLCECFNPSWLVWFFYSNLV